MNTRIARVLFVLTLFTAALQAQDFGSLEWYLMVQRTIDAISQEELGRPADPEGSANWIFHARENRWNADQIREAIRTSPEWQERHKPWQHFVVVLYAPGGAAIAGAQVAIDQVADGGQPTRGTNPSGYVYFAVPKGLRTIAIEAEGFEPQSFQVDVGFEAFARAIVLTKKKPPIDPRPGIVRLSGRAFKDDRGEFNGLGATLFWALHGHKHTREQLEANLRWIAQDLGADYIRVLATVGRLPVWKGRTIIAPGGRGEDGEAPWSDYWDQVEGLSRLAYEKYGLRIEWTLFGDADQVMPSTSARRAFVEAFARFMVSRGLSHTVQHYEVANEYWQNGFGGRIGEMREYARILSSITPNLVALSAPATVADDQDPCPEIAEMYRGDSPAQLLTGHYSRTVNRVDGYWRPVRQTWEWDVCADAPEGGTNNEPIGPDSSNASDDDPSRIVSAAIYSHISGLAGYVYHSAAGVWGGLRGPANLFDHVRARDIARGLKATKAYLPQGLANWSKANHHWASNPFRASFTPCDSSGCPQLWVDGKPNGVVRAVAAISGSRFLSLPMGIKGHADMIADRPASCEARNPATGEVVRRVDVAPNRVVRLEGLDAFFLSCN